MEILSFSFCRVEADCEGRLIHRHMGIIRNPSYMHKTFIGVYSVTLLPSKYKPDVLAAGLLQRLSICVGIVDVRVGYPSSRRYLGCAAVAGPRHGSADQSSRRVARLLRRLVVVASNGSGQLIWAAHCPCSLRCERSPPASQQGVACPRSKSALSAGADAGST